MKIIDFQKKGNVVRFYLGMDDLKDWTGDDWDDTPYEHNAGMVYEEYISGYTDVVFDFDDIVLEPSDGAHNMNSDYCKDDMIARSVPCIIAVPKEVYKDESWYDTFSHWAGADNIKKFYFGDKMKAEHLYYQPSGGGAE